LKEVKKKELSPFERLIQQLRELHETEFKDFFFIDKDASI